MDSGVGGISVLKEAVKLMPNENYIYLGDSKNAPYGTKSLEEVKRLSFKASELLIKRDIKALVIACNTATSAAINELRDKYTFMPVIGIEPALKPAVELKHKGKIIIMATPMTLEEKKFKELMLNYQEVAEIVPLPCPGLVELIESGIIQGEILDNYIAKSFYVLANEEIAAIVLGCTHYPFVKSALLKYLGNNISILDGSCGTARYLKKRLEQLNLLNLRDENGYVEILNSSENPKIIELSYKLFEL